MRTPTNRVNPTAAELACTAATAAACSTCRCFPATTWHCNFGIHCYGCGAASMTSSGLRQHASTPACAYCHYSSCKVTELMQQHQNCSRTCPADLLILASSSKHGFGGVALPAHQAQLCNALRGPACTWQKLMAELLQVEVTVQLTLCKSRQCRTGTSCLSNGAATSRCMPRARS